MNTGFEWIPYIVKNRKKTDNVRLFISSIKDKVQGNFSIDTVIEYGNCRMVEAKNNFSEWKNIFRKSLEKNRRKVILHLRLQFLKKMKYPCTTASKFIGENLDINTEELNQPVEVIHKPMKIIPRDHTYCLPNNSAPFCACLGKSLTL